MKFREYRLKSNLTQQELSDKIGISKAHISDIENSKKNPSIKTLIHMSIILNTCPCRLLDFKCDCPDKLMEEVLY